MLAIAAGIEQVDLGIDEKIDLIHVVAHDLYAMRAAANGSVRGGKLVF
jgi:tRNA threonylcarbamoyladenosine modification (KEOPS) complex  Pcc1 subunit